MVRGGYLLAKALHDKNIKNVFTLAGGLQSGTGRI